MISLQLLMSRFMYECFAFHTPGLWTETSSTLWTKPIPLQESWNILPSSPGLYAIGLSGLPHWLYLGHTSCLKRRIRMLKEVFRQDMPYAAPHTAGPALYAYRHLFPQETLLVSVCSLDIPENLGLAMECLAIAIHRQRDQRSPLCQVGRMPPGWVASSNNTAKLAAAGRRYRGGPSTTLDESHLPDLAPVGKLDHGHPFQESWLGFSWSPWEKAAVTIPHCGDALGIYRVRTEELLFLGHGKLAQRLAPYKKQPVLCSWVVGEWYPHQRVALVTDLLASYLIHMGKTPLGQFGNEPKISPSLLLFPTPLLFPLSLLAF